MGRAAELDVLEALHRQASAGSTVTTLIDGVAGAGKSALLDRFVSRPEIAAPIRVSGDEAETMLAYGIYDQIVAQLIAGGDGGPPEAAEGSTVDRGDLQTTGDALCDLLRTAAETGRCATLIVDDAHLADRPSLTALGYALRRLRSEPLLAVLTTRTEDAPTLTRGLLRRVEATGAGISLTGLSVAEIRELATHYGHRELAERAARRLRAHTGGNPLYVRALLQDRQVGSGAWLSAPLPAPPSLARLVAERLQRLSPPARRLARAAAVLGQHSDLGVAAEVAQIDSPLAAADELRQAQLAGVQRSSGRQLVFDHSVLRAAVLQDCSEADLAETHRMAAEHTHGAESLQHRVRATAGYDRELAGALQKQAQLDIAQGGWRTAADALLSAARIHPVREERDALLVRAVEALLVAGDLTVAAGYRDQVLPLPPTARQLQVLALMSWMDGDFAAAEDFARRAWALAADLEPLERDRLAGVLTQMSIMQGNGRQAMSVARSALDSGLLQPGAQASTLATLVAAMLLEGQVEETFALLPTTGDLDDAGYRELVGMRGLAQVLTDAPTAAAANLRVRLRPNLDDHGRGQSPIELLTATGPDGIEPNKMIILLFLAEVEFRRGRWDVAVAIADQALALIEDTEQHWIAPWAQAIAVLVPAARGQWDIAEAHLQQAETAAAQLGDELNRGYAANAAVHLAACRGDATQVTVSARWLLESGKAFHQEPGLHRWPVHYADALVSLGRFDEADEVLGRWEATARERRRWSWIAALARVRGDLAVRHRDLPAARRAFQAAFDAWEELGTEEVDVLERSMLHLSRGRFLRRRGERRAAIADLCEARRRLGQLGAEPYLAAVQTELAACGHELELAIEPPSSVTALTPQEAAVARLVVDGHSNKEIAEALVLSPKTVAYHLGHVYAKLGVRSRSQLVAQRPFDPPATR